MTSLTIDLGPAARRMADLVRAVPDEALAAATPCTEASVGDLLDHVSGLSVAFTMAATKDLPPGGTQPPPKPDASRLGDDWRTRIPVELDTLADAWRDPAAWTGDTAAGGVELPGEVAGLVALNEVVVHGWDIASAVGEPYEVDEASLRACHDFVAQFSGPDDDEARAGGFGPVVPVDASAPMLDRLIGMTGRHPGWEPR